MQIDPTMKYSSEARNSNDLLSEKNQEMFQKFDILLKDWRSSQKPNNSQNQRRNSTGSSYGGSILASFDPLQLLENSPREIMSYLQCKVSPSDAISNVKNCDTAVEDVIMERRDVIMTGKLKGRRLVFDPIEVENEVALGWDHEDSSAVVIQEREVIVNENCDGKMSRSRSCTFSGLLLSEDGVVEEEEKTVADVGNMAEKSGCGRLRSGRGGRCMFAAMGWLVILLFLIIFGLISIRCNGKSVYGELVPT